MKSCLRGLRWVWPLVVLGCSNGGGGGPANSVNSRISQSGVEALAGQTALFEASGVLTGGSRLATPTFVDRNTKVSRSAGPLAEAGSASALSNKAQLAYKALSSASCQIDGLEGASRQGSTQSPANNFRPVEMRIRGRDCPVEVDFSIKILGRGGAEPCHEATGAASNCAFDATIDMKYRIVDTHLAKELGVNRGTIAIAVSIEQTHAWQSRSASQQNTAFKIKGQVHSKAVALDGQTFVIAGEAEVDIRMNVAQPAGDGPPTLQIAGTAEESWHYQDDAMGVASKFQASIAFTGDGQPTETYSVDGVSVTAKAYQQERAKLGNFISFDVNAQEGSGDSDAVVIIPTPKVPSDPNPSQPAPSPHRLPHGEWICVIEDIFTRNIFAGYGSVEFVARSRAKQVCQENRANHCNGASTCDQLEVNSAAWYCEARHTLDRTVYGASGASKVEASYKARKACRNNSGEDGAYYCGEIPDSNCVRQQFR